MKCFEEYMKENHKILVGIMFFLIIVLANALGILLDKNLKLETDLQTQIEKSSDLEMVIDDIQSDKLIKDYLRSK